jgi:hypothetical protein
MPISKSPTRSAPWWLGGDEECPHCHQLYAYEIEVRCPVCDGPSCPHCVELVERGIVCVVCRDQREEIEETSGGG